MKKHLPPCRGGHAIAGVILILCSGMALTPQINAATIIKADNTTNLDTAGSWTSGNPGANDIAQWDNTVTTANASSLGSNRSWLGIVINNPGGNVTINNGSTLTLGMGGINMSTATVNLNILSNLTTLAYTNQVWTIAGSRTLTLDQGAFTRSTGSTVSIQGAGTVNLGATSTGIINDATGIVGPWLNIGTGTATRYTTRDTITNNLVAYTGTGIAVASIGDAPAANYEVNAGGTFGANAAFNTLRYSGSAATIAGNFSANGIMNASSGILNLSGDITIGDSRELVFDSAGNAIVVSGVIADNAGGASSLTKTSPSSLTLGGDNTYTGDTYVNRGSLIVTHNNALGTGAGVTYINGGDTASSGNPNLPGGQVRLSGGATGLSIAENFVVFGRGNGQGPQAFWSDTGDNILTGTYTLSGNGGSRVYVAAGKLTMAGGVNVTPDQSGLFILNPQSGATLAFTTNSITLKTDGSFYFDSGGTVELGVTGNTWGITRIVSGTLKMMVANALPTTASINMGAGYGTNNDVLDLNGFSQETGSIIHGTTTMGNRLITNTSSIAATLAINQTSSGNHYGMLGGNLSFIKKGNSSLTLQGAGTHTGDTRVEAGTLALNHLNALSASTLDTGASGAQQVTFTVAGANTYNLGGLKGNDDLAIGNNSLSVGSNGQDTTFSGVLSSTGGALSKDGTGILRLSNANTYSGGTTVSQGSLYANNATGSATGSGAVTVKNSATFGGSGFITTAAGVTLESGGKLSPGDGGQRTLTISAAIDLNEGSIFEVSLASGGDAVNGTSLLITAGSGSVDITGSILSGTWGGDEDNIYVSGSLAENHRLWLINNADSKSFTGLFSNANTLADASIQSQFGVSNAAYTTQLDGQLFAVFYGADINTNALTGGNDLLLVAIVPEPSRALLLALAGAWITLFRRRQS